MKSAMTASKSTLILFLTSVWMSLMPLPAFTAGANHSGVKPTNAQAGSDNISDGVTLSFSTYLGNTSANAVAVDAAGNVYITGAAPSGSLAVTPGAAQTDFGGGQSDAFVIKLNPTGDQIIYATYIGGSGFDGGAGIAVDAAGNAYVAGSTGSDDFPTTPGSFQPSGRGPGAVFVAKLNPSGSALVYSTYLASGESPLSSHDARDIAIDSAGNAYVTGLAGSGFPTTPGAFQRASGGRLDAFVAKLNAAGSAVIYSTYLGGPGQDIAQSIAVDAAGSAYVAGAAEARFPTTAGAIKTTLDSADNMGDGFVTKLDPAGGSLVYSTYLGGTGGDSAWGIAVDAAGSAYVAGGTSSIDFPTTAGAFLRSPRGFSGEAFVARINAAGTALIYSTYLGGRGSELASDISIDVAGNAYIAGATLSLDFPLANAFQRTNASGPVFKSDNSGEDWTPANAGLHAAPVSALAIDPVTSSTLYAATQGGVFKSTDGGATWAAASDGLTSLEVTALAIDPAATATVYAGTANGFLKSVDGGASWSALFSGRRVYSVAVAPSNHSVIYAGVSGADGGEVAISTNGGTSWSFVRVPANSPSGFVKTLAVDPRNASIVYAGTFRLPGDVYGTVLKSTDGARTWTNTMLSATEIESVVIHPNSPATVYVASDEGIFRSDDGAGHWTKIDKDVLGLPTSLAIDPSNPSVIYVGVRSPFATGVYKSTDAGTTWKATDVGYVSVAAVVIDPRNPSVVYAATQVEFDSFVAKLNSTGSALFYSTYLGGVSTDGVLGIAVDAEGGAYVAGSTRSANFPTLRPLKASFSGAFSDSFLTRVAPFDGVAAPRVTGATVRGKKLIVSGENFSDGAVIVLNDESQKTGGDESSPNNTLIGKKAGKKIARGQTVTIRVRNSDGALSGPFTFTRPGE